MAKAPLKKSRSALGKADRTRKKTTERGTPRKAELTRMSLIEAAERLIAKNGIANVTTREILEEAGQKNQSALQYHFGSKDDLIAATINERTTQIDKVRLEMIEKFPAEPTMRDIYQALVYPLRDLIKDGAAGKNYLSFLAQAMAHPSWDLRKIVIQHDVKGMEKCYALFDIMLAEFSEEERLLRQNAAFYITILTYKRWCMSRPKPKMSLEDTTQFIVEASLAIVQQK